MVGVDAKLLPLLYLASGGVTHHEPMAVPHMITGATEGTFRILVGRDTLCWHSVILIMRFVLREAYVDVSI